MRRDAFVPGLPAQRLDDVTRYVDPGGREGLVMWHSFPPASCAAVVAREIGFFFAAVRSFNWKVYGGDEPGNLPRVLEAHGLRSMRIDHLLVAPASAVGTEAQTAARGVGIDASSNAASCADLLKVWESVWPGESGGWSAILAEQMLRTPERLRVVIASVDGVPAAAAYVVLDARRNFAYLGGGATVPAYRGRGLYRALVAARARIARETGTRWLAGEASPESAPILARLGFEVLSELRFFAWRRDAATAA